MPLVLDRRSAPSFWWELAGMLLLIGAAVFSGRRFPALAMFIAAVLIMLNVWFSVTLLVMSYLAGRRMASPRTALLTFTAILVSGSVLNLVLRAAAWSWFTAVCALPLVMVFPWMVGRYFRLQNELVVSGWDRALQLEREQHLLADKARMRERARIAQDMHDSLGHQLTLISLQAGALEVQSDLAPHHRGSVAQLRESATQATESLRETIGTLREDAEPAATKPLGKSIPELVEGARASGMVTGLRRVGTAELSTLTDLAARRVVLESLTNAGKHAPGSPVTVEVLHGTGETTVRVANQAPPDGPPRHPVRGGLGLVGLDERVRLVGGTLRAGPLDDGGFEVVARLPHKAGAAISASPDFVGAPVNPERKLHQAQRRTRYGLFLTIGALTTGVAIAVTLTATIVYQLLNSVLRPAEFERISVGQSQTLLEQTLLPREEYQQGARSVSESRPPAGAVCRYYRSTPDIFTPADVYRLCFVDGRLVSKNAFSP
ncbi:histidine kinase [Streptomyces sp. NPDC007100]|uniref:sensor histidine kinase n=1 Tax=unclassified Streptomyces TaxID=2593676 RepID=UPI003403C9B8